MSTGSTSRIDDALRQYLGEISKAVDDGREDVDQVIKSALEEINGKEVNVATDMECSRFLENLIASASSSQAIDMFARIASRDTLYTVACKCVPLSRKPLIRVEESVI